MEAQTWQFRVWATNVVHAIFDRGAKPILQELAEHLSSFNLSTSQNPGEKFVTCSQNHELVDNRKYTHI